MLTNSIIGMIRRRWRTERPFQGHPKESLLRKIQNDAVREDVKEHARRELQLRKDQRLIG
ncbi:protein of unknown function [Methylorubrum extorquens DM4]|uniref:Uncharacterized protein n=1 Tax=Methylorubrum extorquens (strain DSM 6343 / CIP 106787 / DM4) TaxID=661410 RepID=A0A2P9HAZ2_METED|nr:protein of unknown function [Methylorubrum extorquens DM4]